MGFSIGNTAGNLASRPLCEGLLKEARHVSRQSLDRLHKLREQFSDAALQEEIEQLEHLWSNPAQERRHWPRGKDAHATVTVQDDESAAFEGRLRDQSPSGLALELRQPAEIGALLKVRPPRARAWILVDVRYCRPCGPNTWIVGGEIIARRVPEQEGRGRKRQV